MHHHGINADCLQENDVARHAMTHFRIVRIHETATIFHDKNLRAKPLNVRQRFEQRGGFGNDLVHYRSRMSVKRTFHSDSRPVEDVRVNHRRAHIFTR